MNRKSAFEILGLGQGASLSQAKKAFRELAKKYHPDRYSANQDHHMNASQAEVRMKQINRAFHFLAPLLPPTDDLADDLPGELTDDLPKKASEKRPPSSKDRKTSGKKSSWYQYILFPMIKMLKNGLKFKTPGQPGNFVKKPIFTKPTVKPKGRIDKRAGFDTILNKLSPEAFAFQKKLNPRRSKLPRDPEHLRDKGYPYGNYMKYMDIKKKIAGSRRRGQENYTRIERIRPVSRVNPICSQNGSQNDSGNGSGNDSKK
jgi:hypothetical protein